MFCKNCGKELPDGAVFCGGCGNPCGGNVAAGPEKLHKPKKSKGKGGIIALIIVLVLILIGGTVGALYGTGVIENPFIAEENEGRNDDKEEKDTKNSNKTDEEEEENIKEIAEEEGKKEEQVVTEVKVAVTPKIRECTAISTLASDGQNTYSANNLIDKNPLTAWVEGDSGDGVGNCVHIYLEERAEVSKVSILKGYCKDEERYFNNNRPKEIEIVFLKDNADGSETVAKKSHIFQDNFNSWEDINLAMPVECDRINVFIRSVYFGEKYNDTCISEIEIM